MSRTEQRHPSRHLGGRITPPASLLAVPAAGALTHSKTRSHPRILIVDDEEGIVRVLRRILQQAGYHDIQSTTNPEEAASLFIRTAPDLVLLDLHMPGLDGVAVLEQLRAATPAESFVPILMLTGDGSSEAKRRALSGGAKDFLAKPFDHTEALLRIRNLLETRSLHLLLGERNASLEQRVEERTQEVFRAHLETLHRLAGAAECRDDDTGEHTRRVGELSASLAERLECPESLVTTLRHAAPLHDIGKVGIPDSILLKRAPLSPQEMEVMKTHTSLGAAMLAGGESPLVRAAERIALSHHERWDGSGYPHRLRGQDIPLEARIVAVADVLDALTHSRPYRVAWPIDRALAELVAQRERQFDPPIVDACLQLEHRQLGDGQGGPGTRIL